MTIAQVQVLTILAISIVLGLMGVATMIVVCFKILSLISDDPISVVFTAAIITALAAIILMIRKIDPSNIH
jgi:hypothetical protein